MSNLIITIISIALIAVAAIMALYYGGQAFQQGQINAIAAALVNEAQQINAAQRIWATNNNQPDATNATFNTLVSAQALISYPGNVVSNLGVTPGSGGSGYENNTCYNYNGYQGQFARVPFTYNNGNYVLYSFRINMPYTAPCQTQTGVYSSYPNHPMIQIAAAIDKSLGIPAGSTLFNGVPLITGPLAASLISSSNAWTASSYYNYAIINSGGVIISNLCYYNNSNSTTASGILCVFGPS